MFRALLLGLLVGTAAADHAFAQHRTVDGTAIVACGQWQQYRTSRTAIGKARSRQLEAWIDGFLSGYNVASFDPDFLKGAPTTVAIYIGVDNYCKENPLDILSQAVTAIRKDLLARALWSPTLQPHLPVSINQ